MATVRRIEKIDMPKNHLKFWGEVTLHAKSYNGKHRKRSLLWVPPRQNEKSSLVGKVNDVFNEPVHLYT